MKSGWPYIDVCVYRRAYFLLRPIEHVLSLLGVPNAMSRGMTAQIMAWPHLSRRWRCARHCWVCPLP